jgi:hypothetical protein
MTTPWFGTKLSESQRAEIGSLQDVADQAFLQAWYETGLSLPRLPGPDKEWGQPLLEDFNPILLSGHSPWDWARRRLTEIVNAWIEASNAYDALVIRGTAIFEEAGAEAAKQISECSPLQRVLNKLADADPASAEATDSVANGEEESKS